MPPLPLPTAVRAPGSEPRSASRAAQARLIHDVADLSTGSTFAGHRIDAVAGRGGMGVVYRATQLALDRPVALKVINPALADDDQFRERFVRECRTAASLDHPNVLPIHDAGETDGELYLSMRFVAGEDLRRRIRREGRIAPAEAAQIVAQIGAALDAAHAAGIVHRDVKPANVLLDGDGHAYLTDFGLTTSATSNAGLTSGGWVGTAGYAAPEQIRGGQVDARTDVYALGCVLFHALTGDVPFPRETDDARLWAHLNEPPPDPSALAPGVPPAFGPVIARALAKDPDARYASAGDLGRAALAAAGLAEAGDERTVARGAALTGAPELAADVAATRLHDATAVATVATQRPTHARGRRTLVVLAAVVILALAGGGIALALRKGGDGGSVAATTAPSTAARVVATVPVSRAPNSLAVAANAAWVVSFTSGGLQRIASGAQHRTLAARAVAPNATGVVAGGGSLWVVNSRKPDGLYRVNPRTGTVTARAQVPSAAGAPVAVGYGHGTVWVLCWGAHGHDSLVRYDARTLAQLAPARLIPYGGQKQIAVDPDDGAAWIANRRKASVTRIRPGSKRVLRTLVGHGAKGIAIGGGYVWVTDRGDGTIHAIELAGRTKPTVIVGNQPSGIAYSPQGVWVANYADGTVQRIDPATLKADEPIHVGHNPIAVAVGPNQVWVALYGDDRVAEIRLGGGGPATS